MKALKDLGNWFKDSFISWVWGHVYHVFIPILVVSIGGLLAQALNIAGWYAPEPSASDYAKQQTMLIYNLIDTYGKVSDYTSFISLIMIIARLFRDGFAKLAKMLGL